MICSLSSIETEGCTKRSPVKSADGGFGRVSELGGGSGRAAVRSVSGSGTGGIVRIGTDGIGIMTGRAGFEDG